MIDINLNKYINFYLKNINKISVATYRLETGFGIFDIGKNSKIVNFKEKPLLDIWFNVGYFIFHQKILNYLINTKNLKI